MSGEVRYYPVNNGDCTLITTPLGQTILVDCCFIENDPPFDAKADLLDRLDRVDGRPYLSSFLLTHGDQDHCRGYEKTFHTGDPSEYEDPGEGEDPKIITNTLVFSPHILDDEDLCSDAKAYQKEARRRMKLHKESAWNKDLPGNRIIVIGYKTDAELEDLPDDIIFTAGDPIRVIDHIPQPSFRIFIHAPFRRTLEDENVERNNTSIAFMAAFDAGRTQEACTFFFAGDANYVILEEILKQTKLHYNEKWLKYDVYMAPHHCSWSAFNETPYDDHPEPREKVLELLDYKRDGARVVASSKPVKDDDDNPPHFAAKEEYVKKVGSKNFLCTMEYPNEDNPQPIVFEIEEKGPSLKRLTSYGVGVIGKQRQQRSTPQYG